MGVGETIFFMHGIGGASENWSSQLYELSNKYRVLAWDMPGYGGSTNLKEDKPDSASYAEAVTNLLDYLSIERCHMVGQSVAALIAARIASDSPERILTLTLSHPLTGFGGLSAKDREEQRTARLDLFNSLGPTRFAYEKGSGILAPNTKVEVRRKVVKTMAKVRSRGFSQAVEMMSQTDLLHLASGISKRVLIIGGEYDPVVSVKSCKLLTKHFGNCRVKIIFGAGHYSAIEKSDTVNGVFLNFFSGDEE